MSEIPEGYEVGDPTESTEEAVARILSDKIAALEARCAKAEGEAALLREALSVSRGQWIGSVNAAQAFEALDSAPLAAAAARVLEAVENEPEDDLHITIAMARAALRAARKEGKEEA